MKKKQHKNKNYQDEDKRSAINKKLILKYLQDFNPNLLNEIKYMTAKVVNQKYTKT